MAWLTVGPFCIPRVPVVPQSVQHVASSLLWIWAILIHVQGYLICSCSSDHFPDDIGCILSYAYCHLYIFFGEVGIFLCSCVLCLYFPSHKCQRGCFWSERADIEKWWSSWGLILPTPLSCVSLWLMVMSSAQRDTASTSMHKLGVMDLWPPWRNHQAHPFWKLLLTCSPALTEAAHLTHGGRVTRYPHQGAGKPRLGDWLTGREGPNKSCLKNGIQPAWPQQHLGFIGKDGF